MRHRLAIRAALAASLLLLGACASVPLTTMWRMRDFGPADVAAIEPDALRMATHMEPAGLRVDPARATLTFELAPRGGGEVERHVLQLREASVGPDDLVPAGDDDWQIFRLTPESAAALRAAAARVGPGMEKDYSGATFKVNFHFVDDAALAGADSLRATVRLVLAADQSAFTLLDGVRIPITHTPGG